MFYQLFILFMLLFINNLIETNDSKIDKNEKDVIITINSSNVVYQKISYYKEIIAVANNVQQVTLNITGTTNVNNFGYIVIQVQSFGYNLTFSSNSTLEKNYHQNGTSLGFVIFGLSQKDNVFYIHNFYRHINITYALIVIIYDKETPIPGGCNLDGDDGEISPRLVLTTSKEMILVDTPSASNSIVMDPNQLHCDKDIATFTYDPMYHYLPKHDFTKETFFKNMKSFLEVNATYRIGKKALRESLGPAYRRTYIAVPGTGVIFNTIVSVKINGSTYLHSAAYVPTYTYSCDPLIWESGCSIIPDSVLMKVISNILIVIGFIKVFSFVADPFASVFLNSIVIGSYCSYRIIVYFDTSDIARSSSIIISGIVFASIILLISLYCTSLAFIFCILTGGVFSWIFTINTMYLFGSTNESLYAFIFCFTLLTVLCLFSTAFKIIWAAINIILGIYSATVGIQLMTKSNMIYIPLNGIKSDDYQSVNGFPEPDQTDIYIILGMLTLAVISFLLKKNQISHTGEYSLNETEPLITRWTNGSDDVFESPDTNHRYFQTMSYTNLWN